MFLVSIMGFSGMLYSVVRKYFRHCIVGKKSKMAVIC